MTSEETIKALEQCSTGKDCKGCPYLYDEVRFRLEDEGVIDKDEPFYWRYLQQKQLRIQGI